MIRLENVTKIYGNGDTAALRDASFDVAKGEFVFLVGPSGSGKSTLLRLMNRQERPQKGQVWVAGRNINDMPDSKVPFLRRNIGNIFQDYKLLLNKTVFENVAFALEVIGRPKHVIRQQVPAVLDLVGLTGKAGALPPPALGWRAAACVDRQGVRQPAADPPRRRADRQPRPRDGRGHHASARPHQQDGHHHGDGTHDQRIVNMMRKRVIQLDRGVIVRDQARGVYE